MRQWHRWTALIFAVFMLWIAATGVISYFGELGGREGGPRPAAVSQADPGFKCPADMLCIPRRALGEGGGNWVGLMHHLHSGEAFGPAGMVVGFVSGLALLFFAFSGLVMYVQMWRGRSARGAKPRWFWK